MRLLQILIHLTIWLFALANIVAAAEIKEGAQQDCAVELNGEFVAGDFEKFKIAASYKKLDDRIGDGELENSYNEALCLNSPGGSYLEGRLIANFVHEYAIPTRINKGSECFSACAIVFMAGRVRGDEFDNPARQLNVHAKLGFHAPFWNFDDNAQFSGKEVKMLTEAIHQMTADFIRFGSFTSAFSFRPDISASLLADMYGSKSNELAILDTVDEVARWGVDLEGASFITPRDKRAAVQLCLNFQAWSKDHSANTIESVRELDFHLSQPDKYESYSVNGADLKFRIIDTGGLAVQYCEIMENGEQNESRQICLKDDFSGRHLGDCKNGAGFWVPAYYALPPETVISELG